MFSHATHRLMDLVQTNLQQPKSKPPKPPKPPNRPHASSLEPKVERPEQVSPATPLRKRQVVSDGDNKKHQLKRARLTQKNLALFNKTAKNKGKRASASAPSESTIELSTIKTTLITTSGFALQARKNGILRLPQSKPPTNLQDICEQHARSRRTASPTKSAYKDYVDKIENGPNEATTVFEVGGKLLKEYPKGGY